MAVSTYYELLEIPRGRGMLANDVADRIGPGLRVACGVSSDDSPALVRRKVGERLTELCGRLPTDLRVSVLAALALHPEADHQFMQDRMGWAARQINRDHPRAAVRRMKVGFGIIAEQLDDLVDDPSINQGWHIGSLRGLLRMDVDPPQLVEERTIVATADGLEEVELRLSAPGSGDESPITAAVLYGGQITGSERVAPSHRKFALRLPTSLRAGEQHEYGVRFTAHPRAVMPPYYVLTPLQPCAKFSVRVRFGAAPPRIWRVNGIPPRAIDDYAPDDELVSADRFGEVALEFSRLHQGLSYGVRWAAP
ncbi:MAG: hypothetical protein WBA97_09360 [Actinophytocola sp.]|uniref:hypothetical protein n=1 Tax=Actinophytocola sp. TaxID=1872138 RepID=UPI003C757496